MRTREQFLKDRKKGIGGSDAAAILGVSKWKSPLDVWLDKTGRDNEDKESEPMYWGNELEEPIARKYTKETGYRVENCHSILAHLEKPFLLANVDRLVSLDGKRPRNNGKIHTTKGLEIKTANAFVAGDWGEPGTDEVPEYYITQPMHYMGITGCLTWDVAVLIGGSDFRIYTVQRDEELIKLMFEASEQFWNDHVLKDIPPAVDPTLDSKAVDKLYGFDGSEIVFPNEAISIKAELDRLNIAKKNTEKSIKQLRTQLKAMMGESNVAFLPDGSGGYRRKETTRNYKAKEAYSVTFTDMRFSKKLAVDKAA